MPFNVSIQYWQGSDNGNIDRLSRQSWPDEEDMVFSGAKDIKN